MASYALQEQARHLQALVLDVDGILSDGFVTLTNSGDEIKSFEKPSKGSLELIDDEYNNNQIMQQQRMPR